jgi:hypothetical protein
MLDKFFIWVSRNSQKIGYTVGAMNLLSGLVSLINGNYALAVVGFTIGFALTFDAYRESK